MKHFILGFLAAFALYSMAVTVKDLFAVGSGETGVIALDIETLFKDKQNKNFFVGYSTPSLSNLSQGDILFSTAALKGWTRYQNDRYYFVLTKF